MWFGGWFCVRLWYAGDWSWKKNVCRNITNTQKLNVQKKDYNHNYSPALMSQDNRSTNITVHCIYTVIRNILSLWASLEKHYVSIHSIILWETVNFYNMTCIASYSMVLLYQGLGLKKKKKKKQLQIQTKEVQCLNDV